MKRNRLIIAVIITVIVSMLAGCSAKSSGGYASPASSTAAASAAPQAAASSARNDASYETGIAGEALYDYAMDEMVVGEPAPVENEDANVATGGGGDAYQTSATQRKIVTTYRFNLETTEYDAAVAQLSSVAQSYGGYVENSSMSGNSIYNKGAARYASFTLRIPTNRVQEFIGGLDDSYNVIGRQEYSEDITDSYYDSTARMKSLEEQRERLIKLREENSANADLQYLLQIEQEISYVNYQIEGLYSTIQRMDNAVNLTTVNIELSEVMVYQPVETVPQSFGERIGTALSNSWWNFVRSAQDSVINIIWSAPFFIVNLFWFVVFVIVAIFIFRLVRRFVNRGDLEKTSRRFQIFKRKKENPAPEKEQDKTE